MNMLLAAYFLLFCEKTFILSGKLVRVITKTPKERLIVKKFGPISNLDVVNGEKQAIE